MLKHAVARMRLKDFLRYTLFVLLHTVSVEVSVELYAPTHRVTIPHDCTAGYTVTSLDFIGQVFKTPRPDGFLCKTVWCSVSDYFTVLPNGDVITVADVSRFLGQEISFMVDSELGGQSWDEVVVIYVQDGRTLVTFSQQLYEGYIEENRLENSLVHGLEYLTIRRGSMAHNDPVIFSLLSGSLNHFRLEQTVNDSVQIRSLYPLDHELESQYTLTVMAVTLNDTEKVDGGHGQSPIYARIQIFVTNVNDNVPMFEQNEYSISIPDSTPHGKVILDTLGFDLDGDDIQYALKREDGEFGISFQTGQIYLKCNAMDLNSRVYVLEVVAVDSGRLESLPATVRIKIERGGKSPGEGGRPQQVRGMKARSVRSVRPPKRVEIPESMYGDLLDLDNGYHEMFLFGEPVPRNLEINPISGTIRLRDGEKLDFETQPEINLVVIVTRVDDASCKFDTISSKLHSL